MKGLFINNRKGQDSIYESGLMVYKCLQLPGTYTIDYLEIDIDNRSIPAGYDFYFFNYHYYTMSWLDTASLKQLPGLVITMVLEIAPNDPFVLCPANHFDGYCVLDPTINIRNKKVYAFPRPLETVNDIAAYEEKTIPVIGSFGFATKGKGFHHVIEAVNKEFDKAIVRINIPYGDFVPESGDYAAFLGDLCKKAAKPGVEVIITHDYMEKKALIDWCAQNTLNCFLYDRNVPGLAATTDQAIVSGRPLAVSQNDTFRHILAYLQPYTAVNLKKSINESIPVVKKMQEDWSPARFQSRFEEMLKELMGHQTEKAPLAADFILPLAKHGTVYRLHKKYKKIKRLLNFRRLKVAFTRRKGNEKLI